MLFTTLTLWYLTTAVFAQSGQVIFAKNSNGEFVASPHDMDQGLRRIRGKFLHLTDIHPDPYFHVGAVADDKCHVDPEHDDRDYPVDPQLSRFRSMGKKHGHHDGNDHLKMPKAGYYGLPLSNCDGPVSLMNATFEWIDKNLRDEIDFIIWTGDNVRHDNDNRYPRLESDIFDYNQAVSSKFHDMFKYNETRDGKGHNGGGDPLHPLVIPIIPSLGNNDVFPHNLYISGPSLQSRRMLQIWSEFVPEVQQHIFLRGSYYFQEVIPEKLAVISLNTLYFYKANPMSDGCDDKTDPGYKHLVWLGVVLEEMRQRGMKVWISGHVPPMGKNYEDSCHLKLAHWLTEYRDIIVGSVFGHMNIDHFVVLDPKKIEKEQSQDMGLPELGLGFKSNNFLELDVSAKHSLHTFGSIYKRKYLDSVREDYNDISGPKKWRDEYASDFAIAHINPSVIPNYFPSLRVWEYNITGLDDFTPRKSFRPWSEVLEEFERDYAEDVMDEIEIEWVDYDKAEPELVEEVSDTLFGRFKFWKSDKRPSPCPLQKSEVPTTMKAEMTKPKRDKSMPRKFPKNLKPGPAYIPQLFTPIGYTQYYANITHYNRQYKNTNTSDFEYAVEYNTRQEPYNFEHLTVRDWVDLARTLGEDVNAENPESKSEQMWKVYMNRAFVGTGAEHLSDPNDD